MVLLAPDSASRLRLFGFVRRRIEPTLVWLPAQVVDEIALEATRLSPRETGGMLLGIQTNSAGWDHQLVERIIGPGPRAKHERTKFVPDGTWQQERLAEAYDESGRRIEYLGDWHTHPLGTLIPSRRDRRTARRIARTRSSRNKHPIMLIVAPATNGRLRLGPTRYFAGKLMAVEFETYD